MTKKTLKIGVWNQTLQVNKIGEFDISKKKPSQVQAKINFVTSGIGASPRRSRHRRGCRENNFKIFES